MSTEWTVFNPATVRFMVFWAVTEYDHSTNLFSDKNEIREVAKGLFLGFLVTSWVKSKAKVTTLDEEKL